MTRNSVIKTNFICFTIAGCIHYYERVATLKHGNTTTILVKNSVKRSIMERVKITRQASKRKRNAGTEGLAQPED